MASGGFRIATGYVQVETRYDGNDVAKAIGKELDRAEPKIKQTAGRRVGKAISDGAGDHIRREGGDRIVRDVEAGIGRGRSRFSLFGRDILGKGMLGGITKSFTSGFTGALTLGLRGSGSLSSAFSSNPVVAGVGLALGAGILTMLASGVAAGLVGALSLGLAGAGLGVAAFLLKDRPAVQAAGGKLGASFLSTFRAAVAPLEADVVRALGVLSREVLRDGPAIKSMFAPLQGVLPKLAAGVAGLFRNLLPGLEAMNRVGGRLFGDLANALPGLGARLSGFFQNIEQHWGQIGPSVRQFGSDLVSVTAFVGNLTLALARAYSTARKVWDVTPIGQQVSLIAQATRAMADYSIATDGAAKYAGHLSVAGRGASVANIRLATTTKTAAQAAREQKGALDASKLAAELNRQREDELAASIKKVTSAMLTMSGSAIAVEQAIDDATQAVKDNGKNLDINTQKGRNNRQALDGIATAALAYRDAGVKAGRSTSDLSTEMGRARASFIATAVQMGATRADANKLADAYGLIPATRNTKVTSNSNSVRADIASLQAQIDRLRGKSIRITTEYVTVGDGSGPKARKDGGLVGRADGGLTKRAMGGLLNPRLGGPREDNVYIGAGTLASGGEFIVNARSTKQNLALLQRINAGDRPTSGGDTFNVSVVVQNRGPDLDDRNLAAQVERAIERFQRERRR